MFGNLPQNSPAAITAGLFRSGEFEHPLNETTLTGGRSPAATARSLHPPFFLKANGLAVVLTFGSKQWS